MSRYYIDQNNPELFDIVKEIMVREQIGKGGVINVKFGLTGTKVLLERLAKIGIVKLTEEFEYTANGFVFQPQKLLKWVKKDYLKELQNIDVNYKSTKKELKTINDFLETRFYKEYFLTKLYFQVQKYEILSDLKSIPNDLLVDGQEVKSHNNNKEYLLYVKTSKLVKRIMLYSHQRIIQNNLEGYFTRTQKEELVLSKMNEILRDIGMIPTEFLLNILSPKVSEKEFFKIIEKLEAKGEVFKPRLNYYKTINSKVKRWLD